MYTTLPDSQCGVALGQRILFGGSLEENKKKFWCDDETGLHRKCFTVSLVEKKLSCRKKQKIKD
jgi:hypothetical protein